MVHIILDSSIMTTTTLADTLTWVEECVSDLSLSTDSPACISVDLEGVDLSRHGRVSLVQLRATHSSIVWLLDITVLGQLAFDHPNAKGVTVRQILESTEIRKIFYDVRSDADALYHLYGIDLHNVTDVQIVELAFRHSNNERTAYLNGLAKSIEVHLTPGRSWARVKERGKLLFNPAKGGSYEVFEQRPLHPTLVAYAAQDVSLLSTLEAKLSSRMGPFRKNGHSWSHRIQVETDRRLAQAKRLVVKANGRHRVLSPTI